MRKEDIIALLIKKDYLNLKNKYNQERRNDAFLKDDSGNLLTDDFYALTFLCYVFVDDREEIQSDNMSRYRDKIMSYSESEL